MIPAQPMLLLPYREIIWDHQQECIRILGKTIPRYTEFKSLNQFISWLGVTSHWNPKIRNQETTKALRCTPSVAFKVVKAMMYKYFVGRYDNWHVKALCIGPTGLNLNAVHALPKIAPLLDQVRKDGIYNIAPFVFRYQKTPQELRKELGKGLWKKLTKNTFSRNKLIMKTATNLGYRVMAVDSLYSFLNELPSSLIPTFKIAHMHAETPADATSAMKYLQLFMKGSWGNSSKIRDTCVLYLDTKRMQGQNGDTTDLMKVSVEELKRLHDTLIIAQNQRRQNAMHRQYYYSFGVEEKDMDKEFPYVSSAEVIKELTYKDYTATLLKTSKEVQEEGQAMHHCVGAFAPTCLRDEYLVYSITKDAKRYSTLGIKRFKEHDWKEQEFVPTGYYQYDFNQHYKHCNAEVDAPEALFLAKDLVNKLNERKKHED